MGNQQSAEERTERKQPTKLTKPRTNTSTTNLLSNVSASGSRQASKVELPMPPNRRASTMTLKVDAAEQERPKSGMTEKKSRRRSLFRSKTSQGLQHVDELQKEKDLDAWIAPLHRYSTMGTPSYEVMGDSQVVNDLGPPNRITRSASVRPYSQQPSRLSEIVESRSSSPEKQEDWKQLGEDQDFDDSKSSTVPERSNSDQSMNIPIRRRSLQTPGIATRQSSREDPYRRSIPSQMSFESFQQLPQIPNRKPIPSQEPPSREEIQNYYYDSSKSIESPLDQFADLEPVRPSFMHQRTHTPNEMEYGHIGSFKLGSLRITNGAASPSPSTHVDSKTRRSSNDEDYLTCSEGGGSVENPYRHTYDLESLRNFVTDYRGDEIPPMPMQPRKLFVETRSESPLRQRQDINSEKTVTTTISMPDQSLKLFNFQDAPIGMIAIKSPSRAHELANNYMQEIASSPFSFEESPPSSPRLEPTSKNSSTEDKLFEDEVESDVSLVTKSTQSGPSSSAFQSIETESSKASESGRVVKAFQGPRQTNPKPLTKTDSGYNSNASLRSLKQRRASNEGVPADMNAPGLPDKIPPPTPPKQQRHSYMSLPSQRDRTPEAAPPTPPKELPPRRSLGAMPISPRYQNASGPPPRQPPPPPRQPPPVPAKESPTTKSAEEPWAANQAQPMLVIPKAAMPRFLQRQSMPVRMDSEEIFKQYVRPDQQNFTVQGSNVHGRDVPPVPQQTSQALDDRVNQYPFLMQAHKSVSRTNSKETLATIFSMASAEQQEEELYQYDSLARIYENLPPGYQRQERSRSREGPPGLFIKTPSRNVTPQISRRQSSDNFSTHSSSRGRTRDRPSSHDLNQSFEEQITSFNSVSNALGASPYDAAITASVPNSRSNSRPRTPPTLTPRPMKRNTIGMDSPAASQFARERSRQRSLSRRASWDRPMTQNPSMYGSSPPVPTLPSSLADDSPAVVKMKKMKSQPPVSLKTGSVKKGPPPPAWASLSSAARDKMLSVCDSPPASPSPRSPRTTPKSQLPKVADDLEAERQREEQWEAQRRGWALRKENAGAVAEGRKSVELEVAKVEDRIASQTVTQGYQFPKINSKWRPQSFAPPRSQTMTETPSTTTTTTTTAYQNLKGRRSWDTSTATSVRGPSSTYSTYSESVYSNPPAVTTTTTSTQPRTLARTQSYGTLVDHSPAKLNNRNSVTYTSPSHTSTTTRVVNYSPSKSNGNANANYLHAQTQQNNYSNPHWRNLHRQLSNGTGNGYRGTPGHGQYQNQAPRWDQYSSYNGGDWDTGYSHTNGMPYPNSYGNGHVHAGAVHMTVDRHTGAF